jgi:DNA-binding NarL/FixJ family response regulator
MKQPAWAPPVFGGAMVAGVAAAVISAYEIADCLRFQTKQGQCSGIIQQNALPLVAGLAAVAGPIGGFFTLNSALDTSRIRRQIEELEPLSQVLPDLSAGDYQAQAAQQLKAEGLTQQAIAEQLGITRSAVRRLMKG